MGRPDAYVYQTLQSRQALDPSTRRVHTWRDRSGREVDSVLEKDGLLVAIEVKSARRVMPADAYDIVAFRQGLGEGRRFRRGVVLHGGEARPLGDRLHALPWGWFFPHGGRSSRRGDCSVEPDASASGLDFKE